MDEDLVGDLVLGQLAVAVADLFRTEGDAALCGEAAGEVAVDRAGVYDGVSALPVAVQAEYGGGGGTELVRR